MVGKVAIIDSRDAPGGIVQLDAARSLAQEEARGEPTAFLRVDEVYWERKEETEEKRKTKGKLDTKDFDPEKYQVSSPFLAHTPSC